MSTIELDGVWFRYDDGPDVLCDVEAAFRPGATAVVGNNGAGKSTLVRLLNGLLRPTRGSVVVDGVDTATATVAQLARTVGVVFQHPSDQLFRSRLLDEVMVGPHNLGATPAQARLRAEQALAEVGLEGREDDNPYDLDLADRKLATVASVLAMDADVIALDEPTLGQDRAGVDRLAEIVSELAQQGRTLIVVSHDMGFVARTCSRVLVLAKGRVLADAATGVVFGDDATLAKAGLEPPPVTALAQALGLPGTILSAEALIAQLRR